MGLMYDVAEETWKYKFLEGNLLKISSNRTRTIGIRVIHLKEAFKYTVRPLKKPTNSNSSQT